MAEFTSRRLALVTALALGLTLAAGIATLAATLGPFAWPLEVLANFRPQLAVAALAALILALVLRHRPLIVVTLVLSAANLQPIFTHLMAYVRDPAAVASTAQGRPLRLLSLNMHGGDTDNGKFMALVAAEKPDMILLTELPGDLDTRMAPLADQYPHRIFSRTNSQFHDVALYSRWPSAFIETARAGANFPVVTADLCPPAGEKGVCVRMIGLHGVTPLNGENAGLHERQIELAARSAATHLGPTIILGDLNMTPWSSAFTRLVDNVHLRDTSLLRGMAPTWSPRFNPGLLNDLGTLIALPIDHVLVSEDVTPLASRIGQDVGSDHRPILVDVALPDLSAPNLQ
ncbi:MAG TPA: endonuclease/exonuclease/phosphatase family protein [Alphaproteobacteria bacterium]|jgi:endonuclease/exonuclease/phosphatase (EEP) superfamily protein YafD